MLYDLNLQLFTMSGQYKDTFTSNEKTCSHFQPHLINVNSCWSHESTEAKILSSNSHCQWQTDCRRPSFIQST